MKLGKFWMCGCGTKVARVYGWLEESHVRIHNGSPIGEAGNWWDELIISGWSEKVNWAGVVTSHSVDCHSKWGRKERKRVQCCRGAINWTDSMRKYSSLIISDVFDSIDLQVLFNVTFLNQVKSFSFQTIIVLKAEAFMNLRWVLTKLRITCWVDSHPNSREILWELLSMYPSLFAAISFKLLPNEFAKSIWIKASVFETFSKVVDGFDIVCMGVV